MSILPLLDWAQWRETALHLQLMTQIVGKVRIAHTPWLNHGWQVALYPTAHGLDTGPIPAPGISIQLNMDLLGDALYIASDRGETRTVPLKAGSIAHFYAAVMTALDELGAPTKIVAMPNEVADPVAFPQDHAERPYDGDAVRRFHRALLFATDGFKTFRTAFLGKSSPVHFFWGSFDLAVTRFSGRTAPRHPGGVPGLPDNVTREAYSHEVSSAGFWPGSDAYPHAAFYSYAYPGPQGFADARVRPDAARFDSNLGEFLIDYEAIRTAPNPATALTDFLQSTYEAAANLAKWDRAALECAPGIPGKPRAL
ncbi:MAG: DUF5996 family protein [Pseudomonadota bacterium]